MSKSTKEISEEKGYKIYRALLTQTGTSVPTVTVLENSIGPIVWTYGGVGSYVATLVGAFTNATSALISNGGITGICGAVKTSADVVTVASGSAAATAANAILVAATLEIRVEL
jgi:hypothetical protein